VFESLLGLEPQEAELNDLVVEGAINLMNKAGQQYEQNIQGTKKDEDKKNKQAKFDLICNRFKEIENSEGDTMGVANRVKMLIKNMFNNKETGWKRTEELNKGGPKTKAEVEDEVAAKLNKENSDRRREDDRRGGNRGYNNDRNYDNRDNRDGNRNNRDGNRNNNRDRDNRDGGNKSYNNKGGDAQRYQKKDTQDNRMDKQQSNKSDRRGGQGGGGGKTERGPPREIVEITDEDMGKQLRKNFE